MIELNVTDKTGHTTYAYDPAVIDDEYTKAKEIFEAAMGNSSAAYYIDGTEHVQVRDFALVPHTASQVVVIQPLVGG